MISGAYFRPRSFDGSVGARVQGRLGVCECLSAAFFRWESALLARRRFPVLGSLPLL